jgi:hypothetical protein
MRALIAGFAALNLVAVPAAAQQQQPVETDAKAAVADASERPTTLASAADLKLPPKPADVAHDAPVKKRTARVTTCRCGAEAPQQ